jgi:arabinose-5-phosphate isomerase
MLGERTNPRKQKVFRRFIIIPGAVYLPHHACRCNSKVRIISIFNCRGTRDDSESGTPLNVIEEPLSETLQFARSVIEAEASALLNIPLDDHFADAVEILYNCKGRVIITGMGKAGTIAHKIAGTFCSTGTPAAFLHPGEAAHGDLGLLSQGDVVLALSTSGKTREVIEMLELSHHFGIDRIIGITSHPDSAIRSLCNVVINMGEIVEPCPLGLTPTSSTTVMLAIGDALALVLMKRRNFTKDQFGLRHHGGYLGQKATGLRS